MDVKQLEEILILSDYNKTETEFLMKGFREGFDIGYEGPTNRQDTSKNIPFRNGIGNELWEKVMNKIQLGRYAGPFEEIPFDNYIQSPIGLVPKAGNKSRQIFHLLYNFRNGNQSLNHYTPKEKCTVTYRDIDTVVKISLKLKKKTGTYQLKYAKTDAKSAFRLMPLSPRCYCWLVMKAVNPENGRMYYFVDKCLPFGVSISCSHFQHFSDGLKHIFDFLWKKKEGWHECTAETRCHQICYK